MKKITIRILALIFAACSIQAAKKGYEVGDIVNDFKLKNVDGMLVSLADYKNAKGFILIFDCNTCPVSRQYNMRIMALHKKYSELGFPIVAINSNDEVKSPGDSFEEMVKEAKAKNYEFAYLHDQDQEIAKSFGASNTPHVYVLEKRQGILKVAYIGAIDNNTRDGSKADKKYVELAVEALLNNQPISTTKTKAIGCGIKWKDA